MRSKNSSNWVTLLPKIVDDINMTPNQGIGNLVPRQVQGQDGDLIIRGKNHFRFELKTQFSNSIFVCFADRLKSLKKRKEPLNVTEQSKLLANFLKKPSNKNFRPGSYVLLEISRQGKIIENETALKVSIYLFYSSLLEKVAVT